MLHLQSKIHELKARLFGLSQVRRWPPWWIVFLLIMGGLAAYALLGQHLISAVYNSEYSWVDTFLRGRASTPVEAYYRRADDVVLRTSLWIVFGYAALRIVQRQPLGWFISGATLVFTSACLFLLFETFPRLIPVFRLNIVSGYYAYKTNYLPDAELVFVEKPFNHVLIHGFAGAGYSPLFGIDVPPSTIEWIMDQDGFRNARSTEPSDLVILGDSYLEYGSDQADTFGSRLEEKLRGLSVRNLGKSGYSPFQYLAALKRYGVKSKPRYAVMAFYEGNDLSETADYLLWKSGQPHKARGYLFRFSTDSTFRRYLAALDATVSSVQKSFRSSRALVLHKIALARGYAHQVHPDIAILDLQGNRYPKLFIDKFMAATSEEMLRHAEFVALAGVLSEFKHVCQANGITPMVLYIPTAAHVYAKYSTPASGSNWLRVLKTQIAASDHTEDAVSALVRETGVDFLSLTAVFRRAAGEGRMLYYPLDAHWNSEGRELAARFVAQTVRSRYLRGT